MCYIIIYKVAGPSGSVCEDYMRPTSRARIDFDAYRTARHPESPAEPIPMTLAPYILLYNTYKAT